MNGAELIAAERARQINDEGWTPGHDAQWKGQQLGYAARCYLDRGVNLIPHLHDPSPFWPWDAAWWKPSEEPIRNLVKAGALIAAEIDRMQGIPQEIKNPEPMNARRLLDGLIAFGNKEDSQGRWRVTLDWDNYHDIARVLDGDGNILGECFEDQGGEEEEQVRRMFLKAIGNAITTADCICHSCGTAGHNGGDEQCACDQNPWFIPERCGVCNHKLACDIARNPGNYPDPDATTELSPSGQ